MYVQYVVFNFNLLQMEKISENIELIEKIQKKIIDIYTQFKLTSLKEIDDTSSLNGIKITSGYFETTRKSSIKNNDKFSYFENFDDLILCSDEIRYFTAHLYLYKPFINSPIEDSFLFNGKMIYPNYQNLSSIRYNMFSDIVCQKIYNFWDRIGDLIASFFPNLIKSNEITFSKIIDSIPIEFTSSINFQWLKKFKLKEYKEINQIRRQVVHYKLIDTNFKHTHLKHFTDRKEIKNLQNKREDLLDLYKNHISLTINGFEKTLLFLDEINPKLFPDIQ